MSKIILTDKHREELINISLLEYKNLGSVLRVHPGQKIFKMNSVDTKITEAEATISKTKVAIKIEPGYLYRSATNIDVAQKKFGKLLMWIDMRVSSVEKGVDTDIDIITDGQFTQSNSLSLQGGDEKIEDTKINT